MKSIFCLLFGTSICIFLNAQEKKGISDLFFVNIEAISTGPELMTGTPASTLGPGVRANLLNTYFSSYRIPGFFAGVEFTLDAFHKFNPTATEKNIMEQEEIRTSRSSLGISLGLQTPSTGRNMVFFGCLTPTYYRFDNGLSGPGYHAEDRGYGISARIGLDYPMIGEVLGIRISYTHGTLPAFRLPLLDGLRTVEGPGSFGSLQMGIYITTFNPEKLR
jgi:hypothetical protein